MSRYRKRPVEVDAWQVGSDEPMPEYAEKLFRGIDDELYKFAIKGSGYIRVPAGSYIVKEGEVVSVTSKTGFEQTYEVVE